MCLKINWSVKTSWHRPSMGVTRSWLWAPALLYYIYPIHACRTFLFIINHQHHETKPNWIFRLELSVVIPRLEKSEECKSDDDVDISAKKEKKRRPYSPSKYDKRNQWRTFDISFIFLTYPGIIRKPLRSLLWTLRMNGKCLYLLISLIVNGRSTCIIITITIIYIPKFRLEIFHLEWNGYSTKKGQEQP